MREFVAARDRGDRDAMRSAWTRLIALQWDWIKQSVAAQGWTTLSRTEREEAAQEAAIRLCSTVIWNFNGTTVGELKAIVRTVASYACLTEQRLAARRSSRTVRLDEPVDEADHVSRATLRSVLRRVEHQASTDEDTVLEEQILADGQAFLDWALPKLSPKPREVFALLREGYTTERVMRALGMQDNAVHQNSSRAIRQLRKLSRQYAHEQGRPDPQ